MNIDIYQVEEGQKYAGYFTFSVNGQESLWYSTRKESVVRKVTRLLKGQSKGIQLASMSASSNLTAEQHRAELERRQKESTLEGFMTRGKLAQGPVTRESLRKR